MYSDTEWRKCMDNKGNQNKNGKNPRGQNYAVLIMTMLFTLLCVAMMHNLWQGSRTHKMPYSEFNQMLKDHEVESVVIGNGKIQITPKEDSKKYGGSQGKYGNLVGMEYYLSLIHIYPNRHISLSCLRRNRMRNSWSC